MKTITLGEILTAEQVKEVHRIINGHRDPLDATPSLKSYFRNIREQLESKGVLPEYLAYALPYALGRGSLNVPVPDGN